MLVSTATAELAPGAVFTPLQLFDEGVLLPERLPEGVDLVP